MSRLLKFDDFESGRKPKDNKPDVSVTQKLTHSNQAEERTNMQQRQSIEESMNALVWRGIMESTYFTKDDKVGIYRAMKSAGIDKQALNESILTRMRATLPKLKEVGTEVKEETIEKLEKVMKSAGAFSKYLADLVLKAWDRALGFYKTKLDPAKTDIFTRVKQLRGEGTDLNNNINAELAALKEVTLFWLKQFPGLVAKAMLQNYSKAIIKESLEVSADIHKLLMSFSPTKMNEGSSELWAFMDEITDMLKDAEPFKSIAAVRSFDGATPENFANAFIKYTSDAGGPSVKKYVMLPYAMEEVVKFRNGSLPKGMKDQILASEGVLKFLPMNKEILSIIEALAMTIVAMEAMMKIKDDTSSVYKK